MAAHVLTGLIQVRDELLKNGDPGWPGLLAACDIATWTEDMTLEDYAVFREIAKEHNPLRLAYFIGTRISYYQDLWVNLGQPVTREEWHRVMFKREPYLTR